MLFLFPAKWQHHREAVRGRETQSLKVRLLRLEYVELPFLKDSCRDRREKALGSGSLVWQEKAPSTYGQEILQKTRMTAAWRYRC